ncbi:MAG TPA: hypothetical protein VEJ22_07205, partial [Nitrospirota bacterium]|nr:hypothetical protein [Nitrospirota bacterium]
DDLAAKINNFQATLKKENVAEGAWTGYSKMHDRYLYRQAAWSAQEEGSDDAEEKRSKGKKGTPDADASGKLPLNI